MHYYDDPFFEAWMSEWDDGPFWPEEREQENRDCDHCPAFNQLGMDACYACAR